MLHLSRARHRRSADTGLPTSAERTVRQIATVWKNAFRGVDKALIALGGLSKNDVLAP